MGKRCPDVDPKKTDFMTENFDYRDQAEGIWYNGVWINLPGIERDLY
jgi:hypothetical protein